MYLMMRASEQCTLGETEEGLGTYKRALKMAEGLLAEHPEDVLLSVAILSIQIE